MMTRLVRTLLTAFRSRPEPSDVPSLPPTPYGQWIKAGRESRGWSIPDLSQYSAVSETIIANLETGRFQLVDPLIAQRLKEALHQS